MTRLPVAFEPNVGQAGPAAQYVGRSPGLRVDLESDGARFIALRGSGEPRTVRLRWLGAATSPVHVEDELPGKVHYYGGDDPAQWRLDIPTFRRVVYREVYPGTDLVFHGTQGSAEFDFVVAPGADPRRIQLEVTEADSLTVRGDDIVIGAGDEAFTLHAPVVYQDSASGRSRVDGRFRVDGRRIAFEVGRYDTSRPLVIDPVVTYSTYLGPGGGGVGVDAAGNMYSAGNGGIVKLSADGTTAIYTVTLGDHSPSQIRVDGSGNAYFLSGCPYPRSGWFPSCPTKGSLATGRPTSQGDIGTYIGKLGPSGELLLLTSIGGAGSAQLGGFAIDPAGNMYATGFSAYDNFPTTRPPFAKAGAPAAMPAFVVAVAADLTRFLYFVEITSGNFQPQGIAADASGAVYVTGTADPDFPVTAGAFQPTPGDIGAAVVAKIAPGGTQIVYSTYFGRSKTSPHAIAVDRDGNAFIAGSAGAGLPIKNALQPALAGDTDAFVARLNPTGSALLFSTYLGGSAEDIAYDLALDSSANVYVAGRTASTDSPLRSPLGAPFGGTPSNFVTALASDGSAFIYSTYFGDAATSIGALAATANGTVYVSGRTTSTSYPTVRPYRAAPGPGFLARIDPAQPRVFVTSPAENSTVTGTAVSDVWMENTAAGSRTITLSIGAVTLATTTSTASHVTLSWDSRRVPNGTQTLVATVTDASRATGSGTRRFNVQNAGGGGTTLTAAFTSPASGATVTGPVTVGMTQMGASGTPITFTLTVDGSQVFTATGTASTAAFTWNSAGVVAGMHTLGLTVRDGAGRVATATRMVTTTKPTSPGTLKVSITSPTAGATITGSAWSDVWVDGAAAGGRTFTLTMAGITLANVSAASNHVTLPWDSTRIASGTQTLTATVRDAAGNTGTATRTFTVQNAGGGSTPSLVASFTTPAAGATVSGTVPVGMSATGTSGAPIVFTLTVDGAQAFTVSGAASTQGFSWNTAGLSGAHTLGLTVRDGAGRTATATRTVTVSNGAPAPSLAVFITQPSAGATVRGTVWFTVWVNGASAAATKTYTLSDGIRAVASTNTTSTGPVSIPWVTTSADNGARTPSVTVTDGTATGKASVSVTVAN
jgi:Beta-propeller repeat